jgi:RND family efflux transporter MFP subunit
MKNPFKKAFILPLIILAALALVIAVVKSRPPIEHEDIQFPEKAVEVVTLGKISFRARAIAYGNVEPSVLLKAKSEVAGKIAYIHPQLRQGGSLAKGTVVLRIEPTTFEFSLTQSEAGLAGSESSLRQLEVEEKSTQGSLEIAQKNLAVGEKELQRIQSIWEKKLVSRSTVDIEEQKVLQLRQQVTDLQGKLASFASKKAATQAQIRQSQTTVGEKQDTLGRTEVRLPFDARIGEVTVEQGEFVPVGGQLFEALGTRSVEINAQLPIKHFRPLLSSMQHSALDIQNPTNFQDALNQLRLEAHVRLVGDTDDVKWEGKLLRISESIDPVRDTLGLVVAVDKPYEGVIPGKRPPLLKGMYVSVEFLAPAQDQLVIPRKAIHQGRVYVATPENTLSIRPVKVSFSNGHQAVIESGLEEGEQIILTDVIPVIEGLPIKPISASNDEPSKVDESAAQ